MEDRIQIFDTTLRDGEQSPGYSMNKEEKIKLALQLEQLQVDVIEAGFPISSEGDFQTVKAIADEIRECSVAGLCRTRKQDIQRAAEALENAARPRIHTFIATSDIHMEHKLKNRDGRFWNMPSKPLNMPHLSVKKWSFRLRTPREVIPGFFTRSLRRLSKPVPK